MSMTPTPNIPLSAGDVELLREGDWLEAGRIIGRIKTLPNKLNVVVLTGVDGQDYSRLIGGAAFLGRPDQEGWIAHQAFDPPPPDDLMVEYVTSSGLTSARMKVIELRWDRDFKWRPHVPSQAPAAPSPAPSLGVDLAELRRLAEAATPGPWLYDRDRDEGSVWTRQPHTGELARTAPEDINGDFPAHDNAAYIAAANPAVILDLIASARRDAEEIERLIGYMVHDDGCTTNRFPGADVCSCGMRGALSEARAFLAKLGRA